MTHKTRLTLFAVMAALLLACAPGAVAQRLSDKDVQKGLAQMRNFKHLMLTRELDLTKDQQAKFFDVYDAMDDELMAVSDEARETERRMAAREDATEAEYTEAARVLFEQKKRESEIELKYFERFADILTARQLLKLKPAERKIALTIAKFHGQSAAKNAPAAK